MTKYEMVKISESCWMVKDIETDDWVRGITKRPRKVNRPGKAKRIIQRLESGGSAMSSEIFKKWCNEMGKTDVELAEALGISLGSIVNFKSRGSDLRTAYACRAIIDNLQPYNGDKK